MGYFGEFAFASTRPEFVGIPIEDIKAANGLIIENK